MVLGLFKKKSEKTEEEKALEEVKKGFINNSMLKRWISVDEIAEAFLYLSTAEAVTGEILTVDAGFTLKIGQFYKIAI